MTCERTDLGNGDFVIVCSRGRRAPKCSVPGCERPSAALCDYPVKNGKTCDAKLCAGHRRPVAGKADTDYCPPHDARARRQPALPGVG